VKALEPNYDTTRAPFHATRRLGLAALTLSVMLAGCISQMPKRFGDDLEYLEVSIVALQLQDPQPAGSDPFVEWELRNNSERPVRLDESWLLASLTHFCIFSDKEGMRWEFTKGPSVIEGRSASSDAYSRALAPGARAHVVQTLDAVSSTLQLVNAERMIHNTDDVMPNNLDYDCMFMIPSYEAEQKRVRWILVGSTGALRRITGTHKYVAAHATAP